MSAARPFCASDELPEGAVRAAEVDGVPIAVARVGGRLFAFGALCPHKGADLSRGLLGPDTITCDDHLWCFDLASGACRNVPGRALSVYAVREEGGRVLVEPL